ncbi:rRNA maturation RNase YbeY [Pajaroellobacter abortibovis]|uniref:Endoribonuclease YbeY n=1 Tax=Pajaroellobacter abortibovis TaxID=1882918 RepID=A0A1L6MYG2_9BACT|nr:rRNA maturation RNase YbeY [Pajaroellobacter abortibovis]APS00611.1 rRNA maturation RNase YbeY [Pajaroellobacter abortibovis]
MIVQVSVEGRWKGVRRREILRRAQTMMKALALWEAELSILLTSDEHIRVLNRIYRGKDRPTNVLAFAMQEGEGSAFAKHLLGDIVMSVATAKVQAVAANRSLLDELTVLLAHGLLHLLGWDHETAAKDRKMKAETDRLCLLAGVEEGSLAFTH